MKYKLNWNIGLDPVPMQHYFATYEEAENYLKLWCLIENTQVSWWIEVIK